MAVNRVSGPSSVVPEWTTREQLVLASAVQRSGDQNWVSVSRSIKPLVEDVRPTDYFSQKNCALQYAAMLDKVSTPHKRKKRASDGSLEGAETVEQQIVRELSDKRVNELNESLSEIRNEYFALLKDVELLEKGELDHKVPELWEKLQSEAPKETSMPKVVEGTSSALSTKQHPKTPEQLSQLPQPMDTTQHSVIAIKESTPVIKQNNATAVRAVVKVETHLTPSVVQPPNMNIDECLTVKKELHSAGTPTPTEAEKTLSRLSSSSDDKVLSPMQTPQPSTGEPLSADLHIIVQQRNEAVDSLIADNSSRSKELKTTKFSASTASSVLNTSVVASPAKTLSPTTTRQAVFISSTSVSHPPASTVAIVVPAPRSPSISQPVIPKTQGPSAVSMTILPPAKEGTPTQISKSPISTHLTRAGIVTKSIPIKAYLSKSQSVTQSPKGSMLQSLVSATSSSVPIPVMSPLTVVSTSAVTVVPPISISVSAPAVSSQVASLVSPPVIATQPLLIPSLPSVESVRSNTAIPHTWPVSSPLTVTTLPSPIVPDTQIKTQQPVPSPKEAKPAVDQTVITLAPKIQEKPTDLLPKPPTTVTEDVSKVQKERKSSKEIKTLLTTHIKPPVPKEAEKEVPVVTKAKLEEKDDSSSTKQAPLTLEQEGSSTKPEEKTTPIIKVDSETKQQTEVPSEVATPVSSPPSAVGPPMSLLPPPTETIEAETEDDTPTKVKKGRSYLKRTLLTRSRKRKVDDEGPSVESTDTEEDGFSSQATSAVPSPAPSQCSEMDIDTLRAHKQWKKGIMIVWRHAAQHKYANFFLHPVREEDAPGYKDVILSPTDLSTIKRKVESGVIRNDVEFQREMLLMFQNAFMYNSSDHEVYQMAQDMKTDVMENLQTYLATQAQLQLVEDPVPTKTLRGRRGDRDQSHEESVFSPATKKRRTRVDD